MAELTNAYDLVIADLEAKRAQIDRAIEMMKALKETASGISTAVAGVIPSATVPSNGSSQQPFDMSKITNWYARQIPPAPARVSIAPSAPDRLIDIFDIAREAGLFAKAC